MKTEIPTPNQTAANQTAQRVRVGMIGLAAVVLLIGLASAIFSAASHEKPVATIDAPKPEAVANMTMANNAVPTPTAPNEPLAELGVAPATTNGTAAAPHH